MSFPRRIRKRLRRYFVNRQQRKHRRMALREASRNEGGVELAASCRLNVPIRTDGRGKVVVQENVSLGYTKGPMIGNGEILLQARGAASLIDVGANTATSNNVTIIANDQITIGDDCIIGDMVAIYDSDFHAVARHDRDAGESGETASVSIGEGVWLGSRVIVLKGVTIGENTVISAGAVVTKSIPANVIAGGVPAKVLRTIGNKTVDAT